MSEKNRQKRCQPASSSSSRSKRPKGPKTKEANDDEVCRRCLEIHEKAASIRLKARLGVQVAIVDEDQAQLLCSACKFCRILGSIKDSTLDGSKSRLYAYSANDVYSRIRSPTLKQHDITSSVLLGIVASTTATTTLEAQDFIGVVNSKHEAHALRVGPRQIYSDKINYPMIQSWISYCQSKHKALCTPRISEKARKLQVIDVDLKKPVAAPENCDYVALSYVWGASKTSTKEFSRAVVDSLVVTKMLGYKYLWADKNCIDQDSATDKHDQIAAMHLIYGNARLTLIAAAGEDADYGLPGVSRERVEQGALSIGDKLYIRTYPHTSWALGASRWATRGWTLQEALLSKRRLIFTDYQVSFQCNGMHCSEAVAWPYELMHAKSSRRFPENVPQPPFKHMTISKEYFNIDRHYLNFMEILVEYSSRNLSFPSDSLNAFRGILSTFENRKHPIYHVWGVPVVFQNLNWNLKLDWLHRKPCSRRPMFPSWSWVGWSGTVAQGKTFSLAGQGYVDTSLERNNEGEASEVINLQGFGKEHSRYRNYACGSFFLRLKIWAIDLEFTYVSWSGFSNTAKQAYYSERESSEDSKVWRDAFKDGYYAKLRRQGYTELVYFYIDDKEFDTRTLEEKSLPAMLFEDNYFGTYVKFLVLINRRDDCYERLGYISFSLGYLEPSEDVAFRSNNGTLSKVRPDIAASPSDRQILTWKEDMRAMEIRLG